VKNRQAGNFEQADSPEMSLVPGMCADTKDQEITPKTRTMARIGCFSYSGVGDVSPLLALARGLQGRGHELVFFQRPDLESHIRAAQVPHGRNSQGLSLRRRACLPGPPRLSEGRAASESMPAAQPIRSMTASRPPNPTTKHALASPNGASQ
jgi:hypothetical protein